MTDYDYIVVGAGPAGCAVAARLTENPELRVQLLEAGGRDRDMRIRIPAAFPALFKSQHDWAFKTAPQARSSSRSTAATRH